MRVFEGPKVDVGESSIRRSWLGQAVCGLVGWDGISFVQLGILCSLVVELQPTSANTTFSNVHFRHFENAHIATTSLTTTSHGGVNTTPAHRSTHLTKFNLSLTIDWGPRWHSG